MNTPSKSAKVNYPDNPNPQVQSEYMFVKDVMEMYGSGTKSMDMDSFRIQNDLFLSHPHIAFSYVGQP